MNLKGGFLSKPLLQSKMGKSKNESKGWGETGVKTAKWGKMGGAQKRHKNR
jgi:hypothetical protein